MIEQLPSDLFEILSASNNVFIDAREKNLESVTHEIRRNILHVSRDRSTDRKYLTEISDKGVVNRKEFEIPIQREIEILQARIQIQEKMYLTDIMEGRRTADCVAN